MKTIQLEIKQSACELLALSLLVTEKTEYNCWYEFHAPSNKLDIQMYSKNDSDHNPIIKEYIYLDGNDHNERSAYHMNNGHLEKIEYPTAEETLCKIKQGLSDLLASVNMERKETIPLKIKQSACELLSLSLLATEKTEYDCWYEFHGATNLLDVHVCRKNDKDYKRIIKEYVYLTKNEQYEMINNEYATTPTQEVLYRIEQELLQLFVPDTEPVAANAKKIIAHEENSVDHQS